MGLLKLYRLPNNGWMQLFVNVRVLHFAPFFLHFSKEKSEICVVVLRLGFRFLCDCGVLHNQ